MSNKEGKPEGPKDSKPEMKPALKKDRAPDSLLGLIDHFDRKVSGWIHNSVVRPQFLELIIFPFAFLFQPYSILILFIAVGILFPIVEESQRSKRVDEGFPISEDYEGGEYVSYLNAPVSILLIYIAQLVTMLVLTLTSKKFFGRIRPSVPEAAKRMINLRSLENNCSFPSGDTA